MQFFHLLLCSEAPPPRPPLLHFRTGKPYARRKNFGGCVQRNTFPFYDLANRFPLE
jgi:hypothetical protein